MRCVVELHLHAQVDRTQECPQGRVRVVAHCDEVKQFQGSVGPVVTCFVLKGNETVWLSIFVIVQGTAHGVIGFPGLKVVPGREVVERLLTANRTR